MESPGDVKRVLVEMGWPFPSQRRGSSVPVVRASGFSPANTHDVAVIDRTLDHIFNVAHFQCYLFVVGPTGTRFLALRPSAGPTAAHARLPPEWANHRIIGRLLKEPKKRPASDTNVIYSNLFGAVEEPPYGVWVVVQTDAMLVPNAARKLKMLPVLSSCGSPDFLDVPIATPDDWQYVYKEERGTPVIDFSKVVTAWSRKRNLAFFRGTATGYDVAAPANPRLATVLLDSPSVDARIVPSHASPKISADGTRVETLRWSRPWAAHVPMERWSDYKFLLQIDGNVGAYRFGKSLLLGSCVIKVASKFDLWLDRHLVSGEHYLTAASASDIVGVMGDPRAHLIAAAGMERARRLLTREGVLGDFLAVLWGTK